jgi:DNA-binding CsgD family transcriptional regulator
MNNLYNGFYSSNTIKKVIEPLHRHFGIDVFCYGRIDQNNNFSQIVTHPEESTLYYERQLHLENPFLKDPFSLQSGGYFLKEISNYHNTLKACSEAGLHFYLRLIKKEGQFVHQFLFGSSNATLPFYSLYINHMGIFDLFTHQLMKRKEFAKYFERYSVQLPPLTSNKIVFNTPLPCQFLNEIGINYPNLSKREQECVDFLVKGQTVKQIAAALQLSLRTIEDYINNLKDKFHCETKAELILLLMQFQRITPHYLL